MKRFYILSLIILFTSHLSWSQLSPEKWEYYLSMNNTTRVIEAGQKIYFLSDGGIYYFNKQDNSRETLTKLDSLSGADFSGITYNETTKSIVITYRNSSIDIIREDGTIYPINDIKRKNISGDKLIYNITNRGNLCYLSCGFGIVVLNLEKLEVKDSYIIGDGGNYLTVYDVDFVDDSIFAGTAEGIKHAALNGTNLLDYSNWTNVDNKFLDNYNYDILDFGWNRLWAVHKSDEWHGDRTFSRHAAQIWYPEYGDYGVINDLNFSHENLIYCTNNSVEVYDKSRQKILHIDSYPFTNSSYSISPSSAIVDSDGDVWIADSHYGGIRYHNGTFTRIAPDGPFNNMVFSITCSKGKIWTSAGGIDATSGSNWNTFNVNELSGGKWSSLNKYTDNIDASITDAVQVLPVEGDTSHFFVVSYGYGLLEFRNNKLFQIYNDSNSPLENAIPGGPYLRIGGIGFDSNGNLWISNSKVVTNLHVLKTDGTWKSFLLPEISGFQKDDVGKIILSDNDDIWMITPRNSTAGLYVMSNDGSKKKQLSVISYFTNGTDVKTTPMNNVYAIVKDLDGAIWVGTSAGVTMYSNPENVFDESPFYANQPGVDENDNTYHPLLSTNTVTAIAVDGGNRKWCGTQTAGLFLISDDGQHEIHHFTTENSSLISNNINSLAYDGTSGMLYIGTDLGLVAYRTNSHDSYGQFTNVYAYPNPVRENYTGNVYITGLVANTNVKITTVSGRLVYETTSNGGLATWNGCDLAGNRVHTGIYLAFCTSSDGSQSVVTKILFIR